MIGSPVAYHIRCFILGVLLAGVLAGSVQGAAPIDFDPSELRTHLLNVPDLRPSSEGDLGSVRMEVIVGPDGDIESLTPLKGDAEYYPAAKKLFDGLVFKPFKQNGQPIAARFVLDMQVPMPISSGSGDPNASFPDISDRKELLIQLERSACYGTCPSYKVEMRGDGVVRFLGEAHVAVNGMQTGETSISKIDALLDKFRQANFYSLRDRYVASAHDYPSFRISLSIGGRRKQVVDFLGSAVGMPASISDLEDAIDAAADTPRWVEGISYDAETLKQQKFDFRSPQATKILAGLARIGDADDVRALEAAGARFADDSQTREAMLAAASKGKLDLVNLMLDRGVAADVEVKVGVFYRAARAGHIEIAKRLIALGIDLERLPQHREGAVRSAIQSGNPELVEWSLQGKPDLKMIDRFPGLLPEAVDMNSDSRRHREIPGENIARIVRLLVAAGADVNGYWARRHTALTTTIDPIVVRALIDVGADPNLRVNGVTPLDAARQEEAALILLQAGADPSAANDAGITFLDRARAYNWRRVLDLIDK